MRDFAARTLAKVGRMTEAEFAGLAVYPADASGPGLFLVGRLLMTASISLGDMGLFRSLT